MLSANSPRDDDQDPDDAGKEVADAAKGEPSQDRQPVGESAGEDGFPPNPFDPKRYLRSQNFAAQASVKKHVLKIAVKKPEKAKFVRVYADEAYQLEAGMIEFDGEFYLVDPTMDAELTGEPTFRRYALFTAVTKEGFVIFLWPIPLPGADGKHNDYHKSALEAAMKAQREWVRVYANTDRQAYDVDAAQGNLGDPPPLEMTMQEMLSIAFKSRLIIDRDHIVLRKLRGEE